MDPDDDGTKGVKDTDPGEESVDPYSLVALSDMKMIQRLLRKVERTADRNIQKGTDSSEWLDQWLGLRIQS